LSSTDIDQVQEILASADQEQFLLKNYGGITQVDVHLLPRARSSLQLGCTKLKNTTTTSISTTLKSNKPEVLSSHSFFQRESSIEKKMPPPPPPSTTITDNKIITEKVKGKKTMKSFEEDKNSTITIETESIVNESNHKVNCKETAKEDISENNHRSTEEENHPIKQNDHSTLNSDNVAQDDDDDAEWDDGSGFTSNKSFKKNLKRYEDFQADEFNDSSVQKDLEEVVSKKRKSKGNPSADDTGHNTLEANEASARNNKKIIVHGAMDDFVSANDAPDMNTNLGAKKKKKKLIEKVILILVFMILNWIII